MKAKGYLIVVLVCAVIVAIGGTALAADVTRDAVGGNWSTATDWDTDALPGASDRAIHPDAHGVLTFDAGVGPSDRDIDAFRGTGGGSPRSELVFANGLDLTVNGLFEALRPGSLSYRVSLPSSNQLTVGGNIDGGEWIIGANSVVDVDASVVLRDSAIWTINASGEVNIDDDINDVDGTGTINANATLNVGADGTGNLFAAIVNGNPGGSITVADNISASSRIDVDGGTVTADTAGLDSGNEGVGQLIVEEDGTVNIAGELRVRGGDFLLYGDVDSGNNTVTAGSLNFSAANSLLRVVFLGSPTAPSLDLTVSGDVNVVTDEDSMPNWNSSGVAVTLDGSSAQDVEAFSTDFEVDGVGVVWFGVNKCGIVTQYNTRWIAELVVESTATVNLVDANTNTPRAGYAQDALYVDGDVTVVSGGELDTGSLVIYHTGDATGNIVGTNVQTTIRCYGDFDADGDVDLTDFAIFGQNFPADPATDALFDGNMDGAINLTDFGFFSQNFTGSNQPCPNPELPECPESLGFGEWTVESLAEWCLEHLSAAERESFAETLLAAADAAGETQESANMAELAYLITAE